MLVGRYSSAKIFRSVAALISPPYACRVWRFNSAYGAARKLQECAVDVGKATPPLPDCEFTHHGLVG